MWKHAMSSMAFAFTGLSVLAGLALRSWDESALFTLLAVLSAAGYART